MAAPLNPTSFDLRPLTPTRPHLRVIEGGRSPAAVARRRMYLRRRVVAALLAGIVGGFGRGFSANANSVFSGVTTNADGTRSKLSAGDILGGGLGQGAADAADTVSKYLIERAEQYQPVVEMPTGIDVEIVFLDGVYVRNSQ